jgi:hypothetical protein
MKEKRSMLSTIFVATTLCVLIFATGCQSFRTPNSTVDREQDQKVGDVVGESGLGLYWALQFLSWF